MAEKRNGQNWWTDDKKIRMRISEFCGLTLRDVDMQNRIMDSSNEKKE